MYFIKYNFFSLHVEENIKADKIVENCVNRQLYFIRYLNLEFYKFFNKYLIFLFYILYININHIIII